MKHSSLCAAIALLLAAGHLPASAAGPEIRIRAGTPAREAAADGPSDRLLVRYRARPGVVALDAAKRQAADAAILRAGLGTRAAGRGPAPLQVAQLRRASAGYEVLRLSRRLSAQELGRLRDELAADPSVEAVHVDRLLRPTGLLRAPATVSPSFVPDDEFFASHQWHLQGSAGAINVASAWDRSTGEGTVVAVLDTGILPDHPDFAGNLLPGYDFISDAFVSRRDSDARVPGALDYGDWNPVAGECYQNSPVIDSSWHGTHVAGTVAEATHNRIGGAGVAFDAQVLPVRVLGRCGGYGSDIADAIAWASGGEVYGMPANPHPAEVINLSLGGQGACDGLTQAAIDGAVARGSVVVVAAGNQMSNADQFTPANCANVVVVGANRITGGRAWYSNYGAAVDLAGPGGGGDEDPGNGGWNGYVLQAGYDGRTTPSSGQYVYMGLAGTSMAAPHVSGIAALVQSGLALAGRDPLTPAAMHELLQATTRPFNVPPPAHMPIGVGIADATRALAKALEEPCDPETDPCQPGTLLLNGVNVTGLASNGEGALYRFEAQAGRVLTLMTLGGSGDVTLYAAHGEVPTDTAFQFRSARAGNVETIRIAAPAAGTYYLRLSGTYNGLTLVARQ